MYTESKKVLSILCYIGAIIAHVIALIVGLTGSFYKIRSTSTYYYGGYTDTSKGEWQELTLFDESPVLGVFLIIIGVITILVLLVALIGLISDNLYKWMWISMFIVTLAAMIFGFTSFFHQCSLTGSTTSGVAGAWTSSGTQGELAGGGIGFVVSTILGQVLTMIGYFVSSEYVLDSYGGYSSSSSKSYTSSSSGSSSSSPSTSYVSLDQYNSNASASGAGFKTTIRFPKSNYSITLYENFFVMSNGKVGIENNIYRGYIEDIKKCNYERQKSIYLFTIEIDGGEWLSGKYKFRTNEMKVIIETPDVDSEVERELNHIGEQIMEKKANIDNRNIEGSENYRKAKVFLDAFKKKYGVSFEQFKGESEKGYCGLERPCGTDDNYITFLSHEIFFHQKKKLYYIVPEEGVDNILATAKASYSLEKYYSSIASLNMDEISDLIYPFDDFIDYEFIESKYVRKGQEFTVYKPKPSPLQLAIESEFIHPMYAVGHAIEAYGSPSTTKTPDSEHNQSCYHFILENNPYGSIYVDHKFIERPDSFKKIMHDIDVRKAKDNAKSQPKPAAPVEEAPAPVEEKPALKEEKPVPSSTMPAPKSKKERLQELKELLDEGVITEEEYNSAREAIIKE